MNRSRLAFSLVAVALAFFAVAAFAHILAEKTEPEDGAVLDKPVRSLRVWFNRAPDLEKSELLLQGPDGDIEVSGEHTMGENDMMGRVVGRLANGEYTATWKAAGEDGRQREGHWKFTIQRAR